MLMTTPLSLQRRRVLAGLGERGGHVRRGDGLGVDAGRVLAPARIGVDDVERARRDIEAALTTAGEMPVPLAEWRAHAVATRRRPAMVRCFWTKSRPVPRS